MLNDQRGHRILVDRLHRWNLPGWIGGGLLDWYSFALRKWASAQDAQTYFGATIRCDPVDSIQRAILFFGVWEPGISRVIESRLHPGDVFVDIGANIGYDSLLAATQKTTVVAVEASPRTFALLRDNLERNPDLGQRIRAVNIAVSDRPGRLNLYEMGADNIGGTTTLESRQGEFVGSVDAAPLRDVLTDDERSRTRLIKMDVEGAEPTILNDILDHLDDYPVDVEIIIEANPEDDREAFRFVFDRLRDAGFSAWDIENGYSNAWYLKWRPRPLELLEEPPTRRHDLLLSRRPGLAA